MIDNSVCSGETIVKVSFIKKSFFSFTNWGFSSVKCKSGRLDSNFCLIWWNLQFDSARNHGILLEAVQVLTDLNLSIKKAYVSSDGRWFMDGKLIFSFSFFCCANFDFACAEIRVFNVQFSMSRIKTETS